MNVQELRVSSTSAAARVLAEGFRALRFPEPFETEFRRAHLSASHRWVRLGLYVALIASVGSAVLDPWMVDSPAAIPDLIRFGLQLPVLLLMVLATHDRFYERYYEATAQIAAPLFAIGTIVVASYSHTQYAPLIGARLLLVCFYVYFLAGLRFPQALRSNAVIFAALLVAGFAGALPAQFTIFLAISLLSANFIGGAGAYALEHARRTAFLERKLLVEVAELDGLTGLMNRHTFDARAREAWRRAVSSHRSATVFMIDVDHFKLYNDHYGHQSGDECLRLVAACIRSALPCGPDDLLARYGGEEIVALVFDRKAGDAQTCALRIVDEVGSLKLPHAASAALLVSVSVGAAVHVAPLVGAYEALLREADDALYAAKHRGRNCAVVVETRASAAA